MNINLVWVGLIKKYDLVMLFYWAAHSLQV